MFIKSSGCAKGLGLGGGGVNVLKSLNTYVHSEKLPNVRGEGEA